MGEREGPPAGFSSKSFAYIDITYPSSWLTIEPLRLWPAQMSRQRYINARRPTQKYTRTTSNLSLLTYWMYKKEEDRIKRRRRNIHSAEELGRINSCVQPQKISFSLTNAHQDVTHLFPSLLSLFFFIDLLQLYFKLRWGFHVLLHAVFWDMHTGSRRGVCNKCNWIEPRQTYRYLSLFLHTNPATQGV